MPASDAVERLVNLALFLAHAKEPVTARHIREEVFGYPEGQDEEAFFRMFERDKKELRASGLVIRTVELPSGTAYGLDRKGTFATPVSLSPEESSTLRVVGAALLDDDSFPFREALATALTKIACPAQVPAPSAVHLADEDPARQGARAALLAIAAASRKHVTFTYRDARDRVSERSVDPYGLFLRDGRWYLVGRDRDKDDLRVFAASRMEHVSPNATRPGTSDFDRPEDFDVTGFARLPFQYGENGLEAVLEFEADEAWRARRLTEGRGRLEDAGGGRLWWTVPTGDGERLLRWTIENGPGIHIVGPSGLVRDLTQGLERVVKSHG